MTGLFKKPQKTRPWRKNGLRCAAAAATFGLLTILGSACTTSATAIPDGGAEGPDGAPTPTPSRDASSADSGGDSASPGDAALADTGADGAPDSSFMLDGGATDATSDGATPVMPGAGGILRGTVGGIVTHSWAGHMRLPTPSCPPGATTYSAGTIQCCRWSGNFGNVSRVPVEFDLSSGTGTIAGVLFGPLGAPVTEPDGTIRFRQPTILHAEKSWNASAAMAGHMMANPAKVTEAQNFLRLGVVRPVSDSLRNVQVTWNPTTMAFRIVVDLIMFQATTAGTCAPGLPASEARLLFDLR